MEPVFQAPCLWGCERHRAEWRLQISRVTEPSVERRGGQGAKQLTRQRYNRDTIRSGSTTWLQERIKKKNSAYSGVIRILNIYLSQDRKAGYAILIVQRCGFQMNSSNPSSTSVMVQICSSEFILNWIQHCELYQSLHAYYQQLNEGTVSEYLFLIAVVSLLLLNWYLTLTVYTVR